MRDLLTGPLPIIGAILVLADLALRIAALGIIPGNRKPSTGMAWLLIILLNPVIGFVGFLFFGSTAPGKRRRARITEINGKIAAHAAVAADSFTEYVGPAYVRPIAHLNQNLGALPLLNGNQVEFIDDYSTSIQWMTEAVNAAEDYVHVEFYIAAWDHLTAPFFEAMVAATDRGVSVKFLFDHLGSRGIPGYQDMVKKLEASKIEWHPMLPIQPLKGRFRRPDLRNHRKLLVADGKVGFNGSLNLTEPGYNKPKNHKLGREWVELMTRLHGPIVAALDAVFVSDWFIETDVLLKVDVVPPPPSPAVAGVVENVSAQVVPSGPGFVAENNLRLFNTLIYSAKKRISLTSPYFVPDESLLYAVTTAAYRGIDIELFVSELSDQFMVGHAQASYYKALLESGVRIYLYPAPYILHSKHFSIDDDVAVIGSSNMDMRSFSLNYEISLMLLGEDVVTEIRKVEDEYRAKSRELTMDEWSKRKPGLKYVDNVMRLTAALQ